MAGLFHHEVLYRGTESARIFAEMPVVLCGAGAVGSLLADQLVRMGLRRLRVIDRDRVEPHNVGTQLYGESDVGAKKAEVLRNRLFQATGVEVEAIPKEMRPTNARALLQLPAGQGVVVDAFDNATSRRLVQETCRDAGRPCLHVGLSGGYAEVLWDEVYRVPNDPPLEGSDACDEPLARNLIIMAVAVAAEEVFYAAPTGINRRNSGWTITLNDLAIRPRHEA